MTLPDRQPISDADFERLDAIFDNRMTRSFAEMIVDNAAKLCDFRAVFGQNSRVAKFLRDEGDNQIFRMDMFEGKKYRFEVEYDPKTMKVIRVL